jgi:hypothetical protein
MSQKLNMQNQREIAVSWALHAVKETVGLTVVRNSMLERLITPFLDPSDKLVLGSTYTKGNTFNEIYSDISSFLKSGKRYLVFTSNGEITKNKKRVRHEDIESHYVSFIVDNLLRRVIIIDPSRNNGKIGIYNPYIGLCLEPYFKGLELNVEWLDTTHPCQINTDDVFCQSWTMYLVYKFFQKKGGLIKVPKTQDRKYHKLLRFYKKLLGALYFCSELFISYNDAIKGHKDHSALKMYHPCKLLYEMSYVDMY